MALSKNGQEAVSGKIAENRDQVMTRIQVQREQNQVLRAFIYELIWLHPKFVIKTPCYVLGVFDQHFGRTSNISGWFIQSEILICGQLETTCTFL